MCRGRSGKGTPRSSARSRAAAGSCSSSGTLVQLHSKTSLDTAPLVLRLWDELSRSVPTEQQSQARQAQFIRTAAAVFPPEYQENERENEKRMSFSASVQPQLRTAVRTRPRAQQIC